jgi:hypothetical protein
VKITRKELRAIIAESLESPVKSTDILFLKDKQWHPYTPRTDYVAFDDIKDIRDPLVSGFTPKESLDRFRNDFSLFTLDQYVFGSIGTHRYDNSRMGLKKHPETGKFMFPPEWTLAAHALIEKSNSIKSQIEKAIDESDWKSAAINIARKNGFNPGSSEKTLMQGVIKMKDVIQRIGKLEKLEGLV